MNRNEYLTRCRECAIIRAKTGMDKWAQAVPDSLKVKYDGAMYIPLDYIIGHCRYEAARRIGLKTFPCVVAKLPKEQANALRIIDNKTNESEWDYELLNDQIKELKEIIDMTELGFSIADVIQVDDVYPDELNFDDELFYVENADSQLKAQQVTISYEGDEEKEWLMKKLGLQHMKVVIYADSIKGS